MCTALKNHCVKIDTTLAQGQEDKEKLMRLNQERVAEYQVGASCLAPSCVADQFVLFAARHCLRNMRSWIETKSTGINHIVMLVRLL